jgi:hypothetical protein
MWIALTATRRAKLTADAYFDIMASPFRTTALGWRPVSLFQSRRWRQLYDLPPVGPNGHRFGKDDRADDTRIRARRVNGPGRR